MPPAISKPPSTLYQELLALAAVGIFFSNAVVYGYSQGLVAVPPGPVVLLLAAFALPLLASRWILRQVIRLPLVLWVLGYVALIGGGFLVSRQDQGALDALRFALAAALTLLTFQVILAGRHALRMAQRAVLAVTILSVVLNIYELFHPGVLGRLYGRSAGLYQNPNISGGAIVIGALLSFPVLHPHWRPYLFMLSGAGILPTFSRSAILVWLVTTGLLVWSRALVVSTRQIVLMAGTSMAILAVVPSSTKVAVTQAVVVLTSHQFGRLVSGSHEGSEASNAVRAEVARHAWELFADRPVVGAGLGATRSWTDATSTHNMYLLFLAEFGVLGFMWYLLALVAAVWPLPRSMRGQLMAIGAFWLLWGMVSHNLLEDRPMLFGLAMFGCLVASARRTESEMVGDAASLGTL